jgi:hypothetical protein
VRAAPDDDDELMGMSPEPPSMMNAVFGQSSEGMTSSSFQAFLQKFGSGGPGGGNIAASAQQKGSIAGSAMNKQ